MKTSSIVWIVIVIIALMGSCSAISSYNSLVGLDQDANAQWGNVQNVYQRRADLIPNLVAIVKGAADFEKTTLTQVIEARAKATSVTIDASKITPENVKAFQEAQSGLSGALSRLLVSVEKYPELKANQNFRDLQAQLEGTENRISVERKRFNDAVRPYNQKLKSFPTTFIVKIFGMDFNEKGYFEAEKGAEKAPTVQF